MVSLLRIDYRRHDRKLLIFLVTDGRRLKARLIVYIFNVANRFAKAQLTSYTQFVHLIMAAAAGRCLVHVMRLLMM